MIWTPPSRLSTRCRKCGGWKGMPPRFGGFVGLRRGCCCDTCDDTGCEHCVGCSENTDCPDTDTPNSCCTPQSLTVTISGVDASVITGDCCRPPLTGASYITDGLSVDGVYCLEGSTTCCWFFQISAAFQHTTYSNDTCTLNPSSSKSTNGGFFIERTASGWQASINAGADVGSQGRIWIFNGSASASAGCEPSSTVTMSNALTSGGACSRVDEDSACGGTYEGHVVATGGTVEITGSCCS